MGDERVERPQRRGVGGRATTVILLFVALLLLAVGLLRLIGIDGNEYTISVLALTPYLAVAGVLLAVLAFALRRMIVGFAVLVVAALIVVQVIPRIVGNGEPAANDQRLRVLSANVHMGSADIDTIVNLVRDNKVDVLSLQELTAAAVSALDEAGLALDLPYRVIDPEVGGSWIASRFPLRASALHRSTTFAQPAAVVDLPGREDIEVFGVHVVPPVSGVGNTDGWRRDLAAMPSPAVGGRVRVLAGDFNATLDHAAFRAVVDLGYADAAEQTGDGLLPTWSNWPTGPPVTIDHVLVSKRCAVLDYSVHALPGSDHSAVLAEVGLSTG